jgi:hypothetical protein
LVVGRCFGQHCASGGWSDHHEGALDHSFSACTQRSNVLKYAMFAILAASLKASDVTYLPFVHFRVLFAFPRFSQCLHLILVLTCLSQPALGYIPYGNGQFDGQGSGHDDGNNWHPSQGGVNSCDGERSHLACDVRRALASILVSAPFPVVGVGLIEIPLWLNCFGLSFI